MPYYAIVEEMWYSMLSLIICCKTGRCAHYYDRSFVYAEFGTANCRPANAEFWTYLFFNWNIMHL